VHGILTKKCSENIRLNVLIEDLVEKDKRGYFERVVGAGGEGVMAKDLTQPYIPGESPAWIKIKKLVTMDYIITGFTPGNGKYSDAIGAVIYGRKNESGVVVPIGKSSGMTDAVRYHMAAHPEMYIGKLAEFGGKDINPETGTLIHPTFIRLRDDITI
jgi:bifunctional non-homologous end joining protein LigD